MAFGDEEAGLEGGTGSGQAEQGGEQRPAWVGAVVLVSGSYLYILSLSFIL